MLLSKINILKERANILQYDATLWTGIDEQEFCQLAGSVAYIKSNYPSEDVLTKYKDIFPFAQLGVEQESRGFGDTIAKITKAVGIEPCGGCKQRQETLNRIFPYGD